VLEPDLAQRGADARVHVARDGARAVAQQLAQRARVARRERRDDALLVRTEGDGGDVRHGGHECATSVALIAAPLAHPVR
jgi:hypothetical protein